MRITPVIIDATRLAQEASVDYGGSGKTQVCRDIALDGGHRVDAVTVPDLCGAQNCSWTLYGEDEGCYRSLGSFTLVSPDCPRFETIAVGTTGWPVLRAYAHESASDAAVAVYVFVRGAYVVVDRYVDCSSTIPAVRTADDREPEQDPTQWAPPFVGCWER